MDDSCFQCTIVIRAILPQACSYAWRPPSGLGPRPHGMILDRNKSGAKGRHRTTRGILQIPGTPGTPGTHETPAIHETLGGQMHPSNGLGILGRLHHLGGAQVEANPRMTQLLKILQILPILKRSHTRLLPRKLLDWSSRRSLSKKPGLQPWRRNCKMPCVQ